MTAELPTESVKLWGIGPVERIPVGEGRRYRVNGEDVAVFRTRTGEVFAIQADCPHRAGPLADGLIGNGQVVCPLHGRTFELASGAPVRNPCPALRTYPVEVTRDGELRIGTRPSETPQP